MVVVVVDRPVDSGPCQEDEDADYAASDGGRVRDGRDGAIGLKEAVLMAEVSVPMVVLIVEAVVLMVTGTGCGRGYA